MQTTNKLFTEQEVIELIQQNRTLILAGSENLLQKLPEGNWIGGTIPYFMADEGGCHSREKIFVNDLTDQISDHIIKTYEISDIPLITKNSISNGFNYILIPCFSEFLTRYAMEAQDLQGLYDIPVFGWVTGIDLNDIGKVTPKVFNGTNLEKSDNKAVVLHAAIPEQKLAHIEIINIFNQSDGDVFQFEEEGFKITDCLINGKQRNLADYITKHNVDIRLPLVADYSGALINISFQSINEDEKSVLFYAPLRKNVEYRLAAPVKNYVQKFKQMIPEKDEAVSSCNCILNYLYSELEGKKTGVLKGPFTFGEIAYILVNQTLVYMNIIDK